MADVTARWAGAADAGSGSTYKIEYTLDNQSWTVLDAAQAATSPYVAVVGALNGNASYGATSVLLADASGFGSAGFAYIDDALIEWAGKSVNSLTEVSWHSGSGVYLDQSAVAVAHENKTATGLSISLGVVLFRITHTNGAGLVSAPAYLWYYAPPTPASSRHCVVITNIGADLEIEARSGIGVTANLSTDTEFALIAGTHLDKSQAATRTQNTNAFGVTFHQCWKSSARGAVGGQADAAYVFALDSVNEEKLTVEAAVIPDQDWVLLGQIVTGVS